MANVQGAGTKQNTYDAIVIGSGISGGWAAKELTEKGLKTLVLERGRDVKHGDYPTAMQDSWDFEGRVRLSNADLARQLYVSETTVKTHLQSAFTKLGVDNRVQAGVIADRARSAGA